MGADALRFALAALNTGGSRHPAVDRARRGLPQLHQQAVERVAVRADEPRRLRPGAVRGAARRRRPGERARSACRSAGSCRACRRVAGEVDTALESFRFSDAANAIYHFVWDELCDWYIELAKPHLHQSAELEQDPREGGAPPRRAGRARDGARDHDAAPASVRAVRHRGDLAEAAEAAAAAGLADDHGVPARATQAWIDPAAEAEMQLVQDVAVACRMLQADVRRAAGAADRRRAARPADAPRATRREATWRSIERPREGHRDGGRRGGGAGAGRREGARRRRRRDRDAARRPDRRRGREGADREGHRQGREGDRGAREEARQRRLPGAGAGGRRRRAARAARRRADAAAAPGRRARDAGGLGRGGRT